MPAKIQNATVTAQLVELFGLKGRFSPQLDEIVVPVVLTADLSNQPGERAARATAHVHVPPVVGDNGKALMFNGVANETGSILLVDRIVVSLTAAAAVGGNFEIKQTSIAPLSPIAGSVLSTTWDDQRTQVSGAAPPPGTVFADDGPFIGPGVAAFSLGPIADGGQQVFAVDLYQVLSPFRALCVECTDDNIRFNVIFQYRVVSAAPTE
jgi:hypothetical protein